jgi:hypothetical protein
MKIVREIVLLDPTTNGHGRWLVQDHDMISVLSGCCKAVIDPMVPDEYTADRLWAKCPGCGNFLQINNKGWISTLTDIRRYRGDRPDSWNRWGEFWFGLREFAMDVKL